MNIYIEAQVNEKEKGERKTYVFLQCENLETINEIGIEIMQLNGLLLKI